MTQLLQNAVYGTVLILAVAVLRGTLKDRLLPEARLALWAVCLFRLFTPAAPASALSFWGLFGWGAGEVSAPAVTMPAAGPIASPGAGIIAPVGPAGTAPAAPAEAGTGVPWGTVLAAVWIAVGLILAARYVLAYARTRRAVGRTIPLGLEDARYAALPKCARLREGPLDGAPLTFGVARPTVVLTPGLAGSELACVLAHEGVHARRRDNLWHYAAAAALTVFWWDPAVWLMARLMRRDVELSCDRAAVRRLGEGRRAEYATALVTLSTQAEGGAFCHGFGPKRTEERIISVMKYKKATVTGIALTLALVLAVTVGFASNPGAGIPDEESTTSSAPASPLWMCSFGPEGELLSVSIGLDYLEELLTECVADGSMAEEGAASCLAEAKAASQDGVMVRWDFPEDSGLYTDRGSLEKPGLNIYCIDDDGNKVYLGLTELFAAFPFPSPSASISASDDYAGTPRAADEAGNDFVCYDSTSDPDAILREYKAVLDRAVARGVRTQAEADELLANMEMLIEKAKNGEIEGLMFNKQADGGVTFVAETEMYICIREDCGNNGVHEHDGVLYKEWRGKISMPAPSICAREDCPHQPSVHFHNADGSVSCMPTGLLIYVDEDSAGDGGEPFYAPSGYTWVEQEKFYMTPDGYAAKVEEYRAELQSAVDKGLITQEEMDRSIAGAVGEIKRVRSGEIVPFYVEYGEGERQDGLTFTFGYENTDYVGSIGVMKRVPID